MHRLTARFLVLFALAGTFAPIALAVTTAPPHACCLRKSVHQCHGSTAPESDQRAIQNASCCNHNSGRAVTTSQWAHAQPGPTAPHAQNVEARIAESRPDTAATKLSSSRSTRAPPQISIA